MRLHRLLNDGQAHGDGGVRAPLGHQGEHLALGQLCDGRAAPLAAGELGDEGRIDNRAPLAHPLDRIEERVDQVDEDALFEGGMPAVGLLLRTGR